VYGKVKRKVAHNLAEEQRWKLKENPIILKAAIVAKRKRKQNK